jgi:hypothetical protein
VQWTITFIENQQSEIIVDPRKRMQNGREEVFAKCSSLVRVVKEVDAEEDSLGNGNAYYVELAHSTIREYLVSEDRTVKSTTWLGALRPSFCHGQIAQSLVAYLLHFEDYGMLLPGATKSFRYDSLAMYAKLFWRDHAESCEENTASSLLHAQLHRMIENKTIMKACALEFQLEMSESHLPHAVQAMQDAWKSLLQNSLRIAPGDINKLKRALTQETCTVALCQQIARSWRKTRSDSEAPWIEFSIRERELRAIPQHPDQPPSPPSSLP